MASKYATWPKKGETRDQPWQSDDPPIRPRAGLPLLASGSADPAAHELFAALAKLGYESPISRGENPVGVIGPEELAAVRQFRADYNVQEDPTPWGGDNDEARRTAAGFIGPWTAEAILRAADNEGDDSLESRLRALEERVSPAQSAQAAASQATEAQQAQSSGT